jgi:hypothetical protein
VALEGGDEEIGVPVEALAKTGEERKVACSVFYWLVGLFFEYRCSSV